MDICGLVPATALTVMMPAISKFSTIAIKIRGVSVAAIIYFLYIKIVIIIYG